MRPLLLLDHAFMRLRRMSSRFNTATFRLIPLNLRKGYRNAAPISTKSVLDIIVQAGIMKQYRHLGSIKEFDVANLFTVTYTDTASIGDPDIQVIPNLLIATKFSPFSELSGHIWHRPSAQAHQLLTLPVADLARSQKIQRLESRIVIALRRASGIVSVISKSLNMPAGMTRSMTPMAQGNDIAEFITAAKEQRNNVMILDALVAPAGNTLGSAAPSYLSARLEPYVFLS